MSVPFFRPDLRDAEIDEVVATLRSGWLTTGARTALFEERFAAAVGAKHAVAVNSCTAAMHLAVVALGLQRDEAVLVPTMTFAATGEVVRYPGATPLLVDCDPVTLHVDLEDAERKLSELRAGRLPIPADAAVTGLLPVHVGGLLQSIEELEAFAGAHGLWRVDDAAHTFPASIDESGRRRRCGEATADATCFSFYANKTITTGEGGMVVTESDGVAERMRRLALHGLSTDAWKRYERGARWDYRIVEAGFKYNLTDIAAAIGLGQLQRAESMRSARGAIAEGYTAALGDCDLIETPPAGSSDRQHAWHLYPIRLRLEGLAIDRDRFVDELSRRGVGFSVHWRPLHLHPYYEALGWRPEHLPTATAVWPRLVSLPIFPTMSDDERQHVVATVLELCRVHRR